MDDRDKHDERKLEATENRGPIGSAVEECLQGFRYRCSASATDVRFACHTARGTWRSQFLIDEDARVLQLFVYLTDDGYLASRQEWVMELVCRLNEAVAVLGHFMLEWETGMALYRYALDLRHRAVDVHIVEDMLHSLAFPLDMWQRAYEHVRSAGVSPAAALDAARISADAYDGEDVSEAARRALLTVVDGSADGPSEAAGSASATMRPPLTLI